MVDAGVTVAVGDPIISVELGDAGSRRRCRGRPAEPGGLRRHGGVDCRRGSRGGSRVLPLCRPLRRRRPRLRCAAADPARRRAAPPVRLRRARWASRSTMSKERGTAASSRVRTWSGRPARADASERRLERRVHAHPGHWRAQTDRAGDGRQRFHRAARDRLPAGRRHADPRTAGASEGRGDVPRGAADLPDGRRAGRLPGARRRPFGQLRAGRRAASGSSAT